MGTTAKNILVVEDDIAVATMLDLILTGEGYEVASVYAGDHAVQHALYAPPSLILLDVLLPGMNGFDVLRRLRSEPKTKHIPIIMLTALQEIQSKTRAFEMNVYDYITKPFNNDELLARIRTHLYHAYTPLLSPLTGLPGGKLVELDLDQRLASGDPYALLYLDLDHFKALNDGYGWVRGNEMIRLLKNAVVGAVNERNMAHDFVGHIGGEDFAVITTPDHVHSLCQEIIRRFERDARHFYREEDVERGKFWAVGRGGITGWFPLVSLSIAVLFSTRMGGNVTSSAISQRAAQLKMRIKGVPGNCYTIDGEDRI